MRTIDQPLVAAHTRTRGRLETLSKQHSVRDLCTQCYGTNEVHLAAQQDNGYSVEAIGRDKLVDEGATRHCT